jgi:hypothetical protein
MGVALSEECGECEGNTFQENKTGLQAYTIEF